MEFFPRIVPLRETRRGFWMTMTFKDKNKLLVSIFCFTAARVCNMNMLLPFVFLSGTMCIHWEGGIGHVVGGARIRNRHPKNGETDM